MIQVIGLFTAGLHVFQQAEKFIGDRIRRPDDNALAEGRGRGVAILLGVRERVREGRLRALRVRQRLLACPMEASEGVRRN